MAKVFLSYSHNDSAFVEELYRRLDRDGVELFYDQESIAWGANWVVSLEEGIDEADYIVLVISPDFIQSKWANIERTSAASTDTKSSASTPLKELGFLGRHSGLSMSVALGQLNSAQSEGGTTCNRYTFPLGLYPEPFICPVPFPNPFCKRLPSDARLFCSLKVGALSVQLDRVQS